MEKVFKRPDGTQVKISAAYRHSTFIEGFWDVEVSVCQPRKRSFVAVFSRDDFYYRRLMPDERKDYIRTKQLEHATKEEIYEVMLLEWETLKPQPLP